MPAEQRRERVGPKPPRPARNLWEARVSEWQQQGGYASFYSIPEPSGWVADLTPGGSVQYRAPKGNVPNAFHRFMQRLCFGIHWYRASE